MMFPTSLLSVVLMLIAQPVAAHTAGMTSTHISVTEHGLGFVFTSPRPELHALPEVDPSHPETLDAAVRGAFTVRNNGDLCPLTGSQTAVLDKIDSVQFTLKADCEATLDTVQIDYSLLFESQSSHTNLASITLSNRTQHVTFGEENRSHTLPVLAILQAWNEQRRTAVPARAQSRDTRYFQVGFDHILSGLDHQLFLLALLLLPLGIPTLFTTVTTFTVAHSITLALPLFQPLSISVPIVESLIAASIVYIAIENLVAYRRANAAATANTLRRRLLTTFIFGLIHGLGFSTFLSETATGELSLTPLLFFNLGVEAGQIVLVLLAYPVLHYLYRRFPRHLWAQAASIALALLGGLWCIERAASLI